MKTFLKILAIVLGIVVVLSCIEFIFLFNLEFPIYKNLHVEAKRGYDEVGAYLEYEKSKYYRLQDVSPLYIDKDVLYKDPRWYWDFEHPYCYSDEDFNHAEKLYFKSEAENKALNFFIKFFLNSRFYRFYNDPGNQLSL